MKNFKTVSNELIEASVARFLEKSKNQAIGTITAFRNCKSKKDNRIRNKQLEADLKAEGLQHYKALGRYVENFGTKNASPVDEEVFIVFFPPQVEDGNKKLLDILKRLGYKYNQDSILFKPEGDDNAYLYRTQDVDRDCAIGTKIDWPSPNGTPAGKFSLKNYQFLTVLKNKEMSYQ